MFDKFQFVERIDTILLVGLPPVYAVLGPSFFNDISFSPPYVAVLWLLLLQKANTFEGDTDYLDTGKDAFMMDYPYTAQVFEEYEKRFAEARLARPFRDPSDEKTGMRFCAKCGKCCAWIGFQHQILRF